MKLRHATLTNFKRFGPPGISIDFCNEALGEIANRYLILGDNGSGKTTVLQAVALTLGLATRRVPDPTKFLWKGWLPERYFANGDPDVELTVEFCGDELLAIEEVARSWWDAAPRDREYEPIGAFSAVTLQLKGGRVEAKEGLPALRQFHGRKYATNGYTLTRDPRFYSRFPRLPGLFWYDQYRTVAVSARGDFEPREVDEAAASDFAVGVDKLNDVLVKWHDKRGQTSQLAELEALYSGMFPGRRFAEPEDVYSGIAPTPSGSRFLLHDGSRSYALSEMSAGEQAIFPILYEFVRQQVHRSIVVIDELDLNLHPPLAQTLLGMLSRLGHDNQFIFTTHSRAVSTMMSPYAIHRLEGGRLCL